MVPTPTGSMEFRKSTRDLKERSAGKEHTNEVRDGGRDPGSSNRFLFFFFNLRVFIKE